MAKTGFSSCIGCNSPDLAKLIVLRGNSASGKTSVATGIRDRYGRGIAIVSQDNLRRTVLRERDTPGGANIGLIDAVTRYALDHAGAAAPAAPTTASWKTGHDTTQWPRILSHRGQVLVADVTNGSEPFAYGRTARPPAWWAAGGRRAGRVLGLVGAPSPARLPALA
jgi:hypothetical protein